MTQSSNIKIIPENQDPPEKQNKSFNYFFNEKRYGSHFLKSCMPFIDTLKKIFLFDHLQTNFSVQKRFIDLLGTNKYNMDTRFNSYDFESVFPKIISKMIILQKFLNKDIKSFKLLMKIAEFEVLQIKALNRCFKKVKESVIQSIAKHHRELFLEFKSNFDSFEKCEKMIDRTLKRVRNYDLIKTQKSKESIHVFELEKVLMSSLHFGFLFASKIFDINDSIKAFYQFLGLKKNLIIKIFDLDFISAIQLIKTQKNVFQGDSVVYNEESLKIDQIFKYLGELQNTNFKSIPEFITTVKQTISNLQNIPIQEGFEFMSKSFLFPINIRLHSSTCALHLHPISAKHHLLFQSNFTKNRVAGLIFSRYPAIQE
jgi:hypothetical protein